MKGLHVRARQIIFRESEGSVGTYKLKTLLQHFIDSSDPVDEEDIVAKLLVVIGAAVSQHYRSYANADTNARKLHTMTMSTVHAIIDLCANPTIIPKLRKEISDFLPKSSPAWQADQIHRLKALDSFLKESQRFNPPNYCKHECIVTFLVSNIERLIVK